MKRKERDLVKCSFSIIEGSNHIPLTLTMLTSNLTPRVLLPMVSNNSLSTSPVGNGLVPRAIAAWTPQNLLELVEDFYF
jgi:hypothetical protein